MTLDRFPHVPASKIKRKNQAKTPELKKAPKITKRENEEQRARIEENFRFPFIESRAKYKEIHPHTHGH